MLLRELRSRSVYARSYALIPVPQDAVSRAVYEKNLDPTFAVDNSKASQDVLGQ